MADLQGRKIFKVFNQDFIVDERYTVTKELGQGAYGIVWYALSLPLGTFWLHVASLCSWIYQGA
jgi:mitogen-activated protein kinase 7